VLAVVYLLFTVGHTATRGPGLTRRELAIRAVELARRLAGWMPGEAEVTGLLALLLLADARHAARLDPAGRPVLLADQDRTLWNRAAIAEGTALVERALSARRPGQYALQAAIAAVHARAPSYPATDWPQILAYYDVLLARHPSAVAALGRAVALAMVAGPRAGLAAIDELAGEPALARSHLVPAARAELLARLGDAAGAVEAYRKAAALTQNPVERDSLLRRAAG
jgi:RNA polymerase sigma-70 factor (ECF subfamily)